MTVLKTTISNVTYLPINASINAKKILTVSLWMTNIVLLPLEPVQSALKIATAFQEMFVTILSAGNLATLPKIVCILRRLSVLEVYVCIVLTMKIALVKISIVLLENAPHPAKRI